MTSTSGGKDEPKTMSSALAAKISDTAVDVAKRLPLQGTPQKATVPPPDGGLRWGEVEVPSFGGHRYKYIISDEATESPDAILQWMFINPNGWRLAAPSLVLSAWGGRSHFSSWHNSIRNRGEWGTTDDWALRNKLQTRLGEIAGGIAQAVTECHGWIDFGTSARGGMNEVIMKGLESYWSQHRDLSGHKTSTVVYAVRDFSNTEFADQFLECSVPVSSGVAASSTSKGEIPKLEKRLIYPDVTEIVFPQLSDTQGFTVDNALQEVQATLQDREDTEAQRLQQQRGAQQQDLDIGDNAPQSQTQTHWFQKEVRLKVQSRYVAPAVTHLMLIRNKQCLDSLKTKLYSLATRAALIANGNKQLIESGVDGKIIQCAASGIPVIVLHNTGGAAEVLGNAILQKRGAKAESEEGSGAGGEYTLPENVPDEQFLILHPAKDSVEKVINKLTLVLSTVQDDEMMEVGYAKSEKARLAYAWELYTQFKYNAAQYRRFAFHLHYTVTCLAVLITLLSVLSQGAKKGKGQEDDGEHIAALDTFDAMVAGFNFSHHTELRVLLLLLPAVSGFFLTMQSKFNPLGKWASLESGAVQLRSEIYQYRCRVAEYMPRRSNVQLDIEERILDMLDTVPMPVDGASQEAARKRKKRQEKEGITKALSRRGQFSTEIERINSEATGGDLHGDSLVAPPPEEMVKVHASLFDSTKVQPPKGGFANFRRKADAYNSLDMDDGWESLGSDYGVNLGMIEDDFLRDDGLGLITAEDYIHFRMLPMIRHYNSVAPRLGFQMHVLHIVSFVLTAFLTAAAAIGWEMWVPFVVSVLQALVSTLAFENYVVQLRNVNQSLEALKNLRIWWQSLSMVERRMPASKELLVKGVEATVDAEISAFKKSLKVSRKASTENEENAEE